MRDTILKSKHVHLAGTATMNVVAELLSDTDYTIYTTEELVSEFRSRMPKVNICVYTLPFVDDPKERKLVLLPASERDIVSLTHSLFCESAKCWTFSRDWKRGDLLTSPDLIDGDYVVVHCSEGKLLGLSKYGGKKQWTKD